MIKWREKIIKEENPDQGKEEQEEEMEVQEEEEDDEVTTNQNSLFRSRDWLSANQGPG